ncbi:MAG: peptidylprolyl isomerase, partial [Elusimicrobiota bacterium]
HIMIKIKPDPKKEKEALDRIKEIKEKFAAGASFENLAKIYSDDLGTKENGGELGFFSLGEMDPAFEQAAFKMNPGQISDIVRSQFGYHLIKLIERRERAVNAKHILIMVKPDTEDIEKAKIFLDSIRNLCINDSLFSHFALLYSEDKKSKMSGGDIGWIPEDELSSDYSDPLKNIGVGDISKPIHTEIDNSMHLFKLKNKVQQRKYTLEQDWDKITQFATNYTLSKKLEKLVEQWSKKIYIENRLELEEKNIPE